MHAFYGLALGSGSKPSWHAFGHAKIERVAPQNRPLGDFLQFSAPKMDRTSALKSTKHMLFLVLPPRGPQEASRSDFGPIWDRFWTDVRLMLDRFGTKMYHCFIFKEPSEIHKYCVKIG